MRDALPGHWLRWRVTHAAPPAAELARPRPACRRVSVAGEQPGPDGIRHELVARVRREIAAGTYDTDEKWFAAEEALLRRIEGRA